MSEVELQTGNQVVLGYAAMRKVLAVLAIIVGSLIVGFSPGVILPLPLGPGIHLTDLVGVATITLGATILWPRRRPQA